MANLIIKPTTGGSLILQDEGGTAAHTIDASGNHTLSGTTNNLGTVTAGTIGTGVAFQSGQTLRKVSQYFLASDSSISSSTTKTLLWTQAYTPIIAGSTILVQLTLLIEGFGATQDGRYYIYGNLEGSGITNVENMYSGGPGGGAYDHGGSGVQVYDTNTLNMKLVTNSSSSTDSITMKLEIKNNSSSGGTSLYGDGSTESNVIFWEFK